MAGGGARDGPATNLLARDGSSPANFAQRAAWIWTELPVPVIAAVHGVAYGGGLQIALGADLRIVAPDARLSVMEIKWGLVPDMSGTQTLRRLVRLDVAKELTFTGPHRVGRRGRRARPRDARRRPTRAPPRSRLAAAIAASARRTRSAPPSTLLDRSGVVSVEEGLRLEAKLQRGLIGRANQIEAVRANLEKRPPRFDDPGG